MLSLIAALLLAPPNVLTVHPERVLNTIRPDEALGAGIDGHDKGMLDQVFRPNNVAAMRSAGLLPLTYRLRTELGIEAWHWNPDGKWSNPARRQGYFVGNPEPGKPLLRSYGYRLPRRGNSVDQANNDGYSRLDDGDLSTFWKSNPYLDARHTREPNDRNPQWVVVNFEEVKAFDYVQINWGTPFALKYRIEYWTGPDRAIELDDDAEGEWRPLTAEAVQAGKGGIEEKRFPRRKFQYLRILLLQGSMTAPESADDYRDHLGFAIRELSAGTIDAKSRRHDLIVRGKKHDDQTLMYVSSTDPWHRASDLDIAVEEPGFDAVVASGLTNGLPMLVPVSVLYDSPETAINEVRWLTKRHIPLRGIEMGEEPDGQFADPEHYAQLYEQIARQIKRIAPNVPTGGPCYQTAIEDVHAWKDSTGNSSWTNRFIKHVQAHGLPNDPQLFSWEWYPWDDTLADPYPQMKKNPGLLSGFMERLHKAGLAPTVPMMITEYGFSAFSGRAEVDLPGGILNADILGTFFNYGGAVAYLYGYEPNDLIEEEPNAWGNLMIWQEDEDGNAKWKMPTYWSAWLSTHVWTLPGHRPHQVVEVSASSKDEDLGIYAMSRPDGKLALMVMNRNPKSTKSLQIEGAGQAEFWSYGAEQFEWIPNKAKGHPKRSNPPVHRPANAESGVVIAPSSINVFVWSPAKS